jgi:acetolactate synthase-1/2/3 large subunit
MPPPPPPFIVNIGIDDIYMERNPQPGEEIEFRISLAKEGDGVVIYPQTISFELRATDSVGNTIFTGEPLIVDGIEESEENCSPLRPPYAINKIVNAFKGSYFLSDAGTHTTWTTLLSSNDKFGKLLFSGGFGPMGYGLPGAIGVAVAHPDNQVVVICGDGDIQMVIQELATIREYDLNVNVFIIDNSQLGIIRQWEETVYDMGKYQIDLANPDFAKLAEAYGIDSMKVESREDLELAIDKAFGSYHAFLADVCVCE